MRLRFDSSKEAGAGAGESWLSSAAVVRFGVRLAFVPGTANANRGMAGWALTAAVRTVAVERPVVDASAFHVDAPERLSSV